MTTTINAVSGTGLTQTSDGSGIVKLQSNGVATNALAWVRFDGTPSSPTITSSYNVSSVTKSSTGKYVMTLSNALSDANYAPICSGSRSAAYLAYGVMKGRPQSTTVCNLAMAIEDTYSGEAFTDGDILCCAIFGN
jgi:hypothetical protein